MRQLFAMVFALMVVLSVGCAGSQGFNRTAMTEVLQFAPASDQGIGAQSNQNHAPIPPFRLGVFFTSHEFPNHRSLRKVDWLSEDREHVLLGLSSLRHQNQLTDIFVLMDPLLSAGNLDEIKKAGARYGADAVLIVDAAGAIDRYNNRFAWLYPTVIGAYLAPGTESQALVMAAGSLWAVRSDWYAPIQTVESISKVVGSAVFVEDSVALQEAKEQAIQTLNTRIVEQFPLWMQTPPPAASELR